PDVYRGTITGDTFNLTMDQRYQSSVCGTVWFEETITGTYINDDFWDGVSNLALRHLTPDGFDCYDCYFDPFQKTGRRL
ncbi:MAG: hypothetical protein KC729_22485, partial [Candidatus Eisenbacteria bacterium]|nr:hypothetical protein [Candidatus Eisenbacteria bacterium]